MDPVFHIGMETCVVRVFPRATAKPERYHIAMTVRVERIGDRLGILLTPEQIDTLCLSDVSEVEVEVTAGRIQLTPVTPSKGTTYMPVEEGLAAYKATEPRWAEVYRELAK